MKSPKAWLRAWLGIAECEDAINALAPIVVSTHKRLKVYESNVPAIQKVAYSLREKHQRTTAARTLGEAPSGDLA